MTYLHLNEQIVQNDAFVERDCDKHPKAGSSPTGDVFKTLM
jgi:hypothetical protein